MKRVRAGVLVAVLALTACGSDGDGDSDGDSGTAATDDAVDAQGVAGLVSINSLGLGVDVPWDVPVPSDARLADTVEGDAATAGDSGQTTLLLDSDVDRAALPAEYDRWFMDTFENVTSDPTLDSWQGVELTDTGSHGIGVFVSGCEDCPDYATRITVQIFEI